MSTSLASSGVPTPATAAASSLTCADPGGAEPVGGHFAQGAAQQPAKHQGAGSQHDAPHHLQPAGTGVGRCLADGMPKWAACSGAGTGSSPAGSGQLMRRTRNAPTKRQMSASAGAAWGARRPQPVGSRAGAQQAIPGSPCVESHACLMLQLLALPGLAAALPARNLPCLPSLALTVSLLTVEVCLQAQPQYHAGRQRELEQEDVEDAHVVLRVPGAGCMHAGRAVEGGHKDVRRHGWIPRQQRRGGRQLVGAKADEGGGAAPGADTWRKTRVRHTDRAPAAITSRMARSCTGEGVGACMVRAAPERGAGGASKRCMGEGKRVMPSPMAGPGKVSGAHLVEDILELPHGRRVELCWSAKRSRRRRRGQ